MKNLPKIDFFGIVKDRVPLFEDREKDRERSDATKTFKTLIKEKFIFLLV